MNTPLITTLVSTWNSTERPWRAEVRVDGYTVAKSFHATRESAFAWCERAKADKLKEVNRG